MASAAILAGGRATRFEGRDKSRLRVGRHSILEHQMAVLGQVSDDVMLIVASREQRTDAPPQLRVVADRRPGCGPLGGLDAALAAARHDAVVVVACDMPFVTAGLLERLLALTADADAVVPCTERGYHPLCAAYTRACQPAIAVHLEARRLRMTEFLEDVRVRVVSSAELDALGDRHRLLANVNTPADYDAIAADLNHEL
jgi:molybdopterin-guanine dinucleotide biosynthesis protein A